LHLVVDGNLADAARIKPAADGTWKARVDTSAWSDPNTVHSITAWAADSGASASQTVRVQRPWREVLDAIDPDGDDHGPTGRYQYPTDEGYAGRPMDLRRVRAFTSGGALQLELTMKQISTGWNPANGFDRVAFTVFIELPGQAGGATVLPLQGAELPGDMRWHLRLRTHGWSNALFGWQGASATQEGQALAGAPALDVDAKAGTVRMTFSAAALGRLGSLAGLRLYVTTWDYDGGYLALAPRAGPFAFGGGAAGAPKVMDDTAVLTLPP
jgi:carbohydrate-binding DOMON domain-containing protein